MLTPPANYCDVHAVTNGQCARKGNEPRVPFVAKEGGTGKQHYASDN